MNSREEEEEGLYLRLETRKQRLALTFLTFWYQPSRFFLGGG